MTSAGARSSSPPGSSTSTAVRRGGVWGLERGYCLMIGGPDDAVARLDPDLQGARARRRNSAAHARARAEIQRTAEQGYLHCGPAGGGHFVKMVHNGIEYGVMAAYAEGFNLLHHANAGAAGQAVNAETSPLREPEHYQYDFDLPAVSELWRRGSVVASWLLDLTAQAMVQSPDLSDFAGRRRRFRRGPLDEHRGDRDRHPDAGPDDRPVLALHLSWRGGVRQQGPVRDALGLRRARGAQEGRRVMPLSIKPAGGIDFLALGALVLASTPASSLPKGPLIRRPRLRRQNTTSPRTSSDCFGLNTGVATAMVKYGIGDLVQGRVRGDGVKPFYKWFAARRRPRPEHRDGVQ